MAAQHATQKPLLPGIAPHLFRTRAPGRAHPHRKMVIVNKDAESSVRPRTPSDNSTVVAPTLEELQAELRALRQSNDERYEELRRRVETSTTWIPSQAASAVQARLGEARVRLVDFLCCYNVTYSGRSQGMNLQKLPGILDNFSCPRAIRRRLRNSTTDTDKTLQTFFDGCAAACAFHASSAEQIAANLAALTDAVRAQPLPVLTNVSHGIVDFNFVRNLIFAALFSPYAAYAGFAQDLAALIATTCGDARAVADSVTQLREFYANEARLSSFADIWGHWRIWCSGWKHTSLVAPSLSTHGALRAYFQNGAPPAAGTVCAVDEALFPDEALETMFSLVSGESVNASKSLLRFKTKYVVWETGTMTTPLSPFAVMTSPESSPLNQLL
ncbi:hypothetical protein GGX14DRAFT_658463 [Mycena pura]|uniref:Uncharacterized protein n=1 Tax=Mycena pura TaxID=153505 RepID=A0AAD6YMB8_9AGAR|nr:hypothetical protein GGX14DRAFT_658463 [Mycena pura]